MIGLKTNVSQRGEIVDLGFSRGRGLEIVRVLQKEGEEPYGKVTFNEALSIKVLIHPF